MEVQHLFDPQSMDLNALYQQDIDLGVDWLSFEPLKSVKEVQVEKKDTYDLENYVLDGETGEYVLIQQQNTSPQPQTTTVSTENLNHTQQEQTEFNIADCFEFLESSMNSGTGENLQPVPEVGPAPTITDLTSLIERTENNVTEPVSAGIWDDIARLSELAGLTFDADELTRSEDSSSDTAIDATGIQQARYQQIQYQTGVYSNMTQMQDKVQKQQTIEEPYYQVENQFHNFPTPPYPGQSDSPALYIQSPPNLSYNSDSENQSPDGSPGYQETEISELLMSQQTDLLLQLENSQIRAGHPPPAINANDVISPGSWFFGGDEPNVTFQQALNDFDIPQELQNQNGPYINPSNTPYVPPPIPEILTNDRGRISMMSESSEEGSQISLDSGYTDANMQLMDIEMMDHEQDQSDMQENHVNMNMNHIYTATKVEKQERDAMAKEERKRSLRESRDLKKARELNIDLTLDQIINSPVEEYNELLARTALNPTQQSLVRDIRRRGKNKVAAQNCRKRKIETISSMEIDIDELNMKRQSLAKKQRELEAAKSSIKGKYANLYKKIFNSLRDQTGRPYDHSRFCLEQVEGAIILVPRNNSKLGTEDKRMDNRSVAFFDLSKVKIEKDD